MKRLLRILVLVFFVAAYSAADEIGDAKVAARLHAEIDTQGYSSLLWGIGSLGASVFLFPFIGGAGVMIAAYSSGDNQAMPAQRFIWANEEFGRNSLLVYEDEYMATAIKIRRDKNVVAAWVGAGAVVGAYTIFILAMLLASQQDRRFVDVTAGRVGGHQKISVEATRTL